MRCSHPMPDSYPDLYIYYQVRQENAAPLQALVAALQLQLAAGHGVAGQLKRRPETTDGMQTWMEVYPATPAGFASALELAARDSALAALTAGPRHTEVFMDMCPCA